MSRTVDERRYYNSLDLLKLLMALMVVVIHRPLFGGEHISLKYYSKITVAGLAVPFFFACAGFLFYAKWRQDKRYTPHYIKRIFILYALWSAIYLPCSFVKAFSGHYNEITPRLLAGQALTYCRDFFLSTSFVHFWYLTATILGVLLFSLLLKRLPPAPIAAGAVVISAALTVLELTDAGASALAYVPDVVINTLRDSLPCLALGAMCVGREYGSGRRRAVVLCSAALVVYFLTDILLFNLFGSEISQPVRNVTKLFAAAAIVCIFSGVCSVKTSGKFRMMRNLSTLIYCSHLLIMTEGFRYIAAVTGFRPLEESRPLRYLLTVLFAVAVSFLILGLSRIKRLRFLRYFY